MSRAFTKERDDAPEPAITSRDPARPVAFTQFGLQAFRQRYEQTTDPNERKRMEAILAVAFAKAPPKNKARAGFGATVRVRDDSGRDQEFTIVGEEEIDIRAGRISEESPLGQALVGGKTGDQVRWHRPAGDKMLTIVSIKY